MAKVFVTQLPARLDEGSWVPRINVLPAKEFGDIVELVHPGLSFHEADPTFTAAMRRLAEEFSPEAGDQLLPLGDPMLMAGAAAALGAKHRSFGLLKWDKQLRRYLSYTVTGYAS